MKCSSVALSGRVERVDQVFYHRATKKRANAAFIYETNCLFTLKLSLAVYDILIFPSKVEQITGNEERQTSLIHSFPHLSKFRIQAKQETLILSVLYAQTEWQWRSSSSTLYLKSNISMDLITAAGSSVKPFL